MLSDRLQILPADLDAPAAIGVSGGRDSVALLHLLLERGHRGLTVCHLDHGLREESADEARFVADLAAQLGLPFRSERADVAALARAKKKSLETAARDARYAFFARVARDLRSPRTFLAHHADDQVETFLFNLFRGSGTAGLRGMRPVSTRSVNGIPLRLIRPMLGITRREIDSLISERGLAYRDDLSNTDPRHTRNRVRGQLLPILEETFGRDVRAAVWRAAEILGAEDEFISNVPEIREEVASAPELSVAAVKALPLALQRRLLHRWLCARGVADIAFDDVEAVRALLDLGQPAKVNLAGGVHARRRAGKLFIEDGK